MSSLKGRTIGLGVGGGIAAYKACELARELMRRGAKVRVVMTQAATQFVSPLTFEALTRSPVLVDLFGPNREATYGHLETAHVSDVFVVAPATADLIAKIRAGLAGDAVTTSLVACRCPILLAPAMNTAMWENPVVQKNLEAVLADRRYGQVGPGVGDLADGESGPGRMAEPVLIADAAEGLLRPQDLPGVKVLVTAGPTREPLDPVRFLSNPSSGKMGLALARAARERGAEVLIVLGPTDLPPPLGVTCVRVTTAAEMAAAVRSRLDGVRAFLAAAAVSDWRPKHVAPQKVKKSGARQTLELERTPDVLMEVSKAFARRAGRPVLVGFAAETQELVANATTKLAAKGLDLVVANDVSLRDRGFGTEENVATLIDRSGATGLPRMTKVALAHAILDRVVALLARGSAARGRS